MPNCICVQGGPKMLQTTAKISINHVKTVRKKLDVFVKFMRKRSNAMVYVGMC